MCRSRGRFREVLVSRERRVCPASRASGRALCTIVPRVWIDTRVISPRLYDLLFSVFGRRRANMARITAHVRNGVSYLFRYETGAQPKEVPTSYDCRICLPDLMHRPTPIACFNFLFFTTVHYHKKTHTGASVAADSSAREMTRTSAMSKEFLLRPRPSTSAQTPLVPPSPPPYLLW